jgi:hypothetical protein
MSQYIVPNNIIRKELQRYHIIPDNRIEVIGWWQRDCYKQTSIFQTRETFFQSIEVSSNRRLLLFAANPYRLGRHEPDIIRHIRKQMQQGVYGLPCTLLVRPHPLDTDWQQRLGIFHNPPDVIVQPAETGRLSHLTNLLYHADVLLASQGSISLDAMALDTPIINIGFDGDLNVTYYDSVRRYYEMDHYASVVASGAVCLVESYTELDTAIQDCLHNPDINRTQRDQLRQDLLEPFDGYASQRLVQSILNQASGRIYHTSHINWGDS